MIDQVQVKFGASLRGLIAGVEEAKKAITSVRGPVDELITGFRELAKAIGAAFVGEKVGDLAKEMAELTEKALNLATAVGTTPGKFSLLGSSMRLAGGRDGSSNADKAARKEAELFAAEERIKLAEAKDNIGQITAIYNEWLTEVAAVYGRDSVRYMSLEREKVEATQRAAEKRAHIEKEEAKKAEEYWNKIYHHMNEMAKEAQRQVNAAYSKIAGPLEHGISGAMTNTVLGIRQQGGAHEVVLGLEKDLVGGMMNNVVKGVGDSLMKPLFTSLFPQGSLLGGLGNLLFGSEQTMQTSLLTVIASNTTAIAAATATTAATTGTSAVTGGVGGVFGAIGAIPVLGKIGSFVAGIFTQGGIVPSAAGGWALPAFTGGMPALLHSREMVLPADLSQGMQNMIRSGGAGDVHVHLGFNGPADGASIGRWFASNRGDLAAAIRGAWDSGALNLSGIQ